MYCIGDECIVDKTNKPSKNCVILDNRCCENGSFEYFVHYDGMDRRFDEWIPSSCIKNIRKRALQREENLPVKRSRRNKEFSPTSTEQVDYDHVLEEEHFEATKVKYIKTVRFGNYELDTWYFSPYPEDYGKQPHLFICEFCFLYMKTEKEMRIHMGHCTSQKSPKGVEIFKDGNLFLFEVSGSTDKLFCQSICLFSKLFMDHKSIFYDTSKFMFYVLYEHKDNGYSPVGYFSKELNCVENYNLNCVLIFPPFQRKGYGKLLIQISYELSRRENIIGTPEKPLSDLGMASYRSYWAYKIVGELMNMMDTSACSLKQLSQATCIDERDILSTLEWLRLPSESHSNTSTIRVDFKQLDQLWKSVARAPHLILNSRLLRWRPK